VGNFEPLEKKTGGFKLEGIFKKRNKTLGKFFGGKRGKAREKLVG